MGQSLSPEGFLEQYPLLLESHSVDRDPRHRTRRGPGRATSATNARTVWRAPTPGFGKLTTKWIRGGPRSFAPFAKGPATDSSGWARQSEAGALPLRARQPLRACQPSRGARRRRPHHLTGTSAPTTPENAPALEGDGSDGTAVDPPGPAGAVSTRPAQEPVAVPTGPPVACRPRGCHWRCPGSPASLRPPGRAPLRTPGRSSRRTLPWRSAASCQGCGSDGGARSLRGQGWRPLPVP